MKLLRKALGLVLLAGIVGAGAFHFRVDHLVNRPVPSAAAARPAAATRYYFAYGANMSRRYLYNARGVLPQGSAPGRIADHEVVFLAPGLNALEPAFAYLVRAEGGSAYGVLHRVTDADLPRIKESEGPLHRWATLPVELATGQVVPAQALLRVSGGEAGTPSRRYLGILIEGAAEHGLPAEYQTKLHATPSVYVPIASELMGDAIEATVMTRSGRCASVLVC